MYLNRPGITTSATNGLATASHSYLLLVKTGPFYVIEMTPTTVTIYEESIRNAASVDWPRVASAPKDASAEDRRAEGDENNVEREATHARGASLEDENVANAVLDHDVDRLGRHVG